MTKTANNSLDAVMTTLVLCSVDEQSVVLSEIFRVLKPGSLMDVAVFLLRIVYSLSPQRKRLGGRFLFLEHVICPHEESNSWLLRPLQQKLSPFWRLIGGGCELDRDTEKVFIYWSSW